MHRRLPQPLPDPGDRGVPRYSGRPLPPYRYVPGLQPHPTRDPAGHSYGRSVDGTHRCVDPNDWAGVEAWRFGVDLFNRFYFWEAHEAWEEVWRAVPSGSPTEQLLHGLIQVAAALLKLHLNRRDAACRLADAGIGRVSQAGSVERLLGVTPATAAAAFAAYFAPLRTGGRVVLGPAVPVLRLDVAPPA